MQELALEEALEWQTIEGLENFCFSILEVNRERGYAAVVFKLEANKPIVLHRHCSYNYTLVLKGEHLIYDVDGSISEVRKTGTYKVIAPDEKPHAESGGDGGATVLFHIYDSPDSGPVYELLDEQQQLIGTLCMDDLEALQQQQKPAT